MGICDMFKMVYLFFLQEVQSLDLSDPSISCIITEAVETLENAKGEVPTNFSIFLQKIIGYFESPKKFYTYDQTIKFHAFIEFARMVADLFDKQAVLVRDAMLRTHHDQENLCFLNERLTIGILAANRLVNLISEVSMDMYVKHNLLTFEENDKLNAIVKDISRVLQETILCPFGLTGTMCPSHPYPFLMHVRLASSGPCNDILATYYVSKNPPIITYEKTHRTITLFTTKQDMWEIKEYSTLDIHQRLQYLALVLYKVRPEIALLLQKNLPETFLVLVPKEDIEDIRAGLNFCNEKLLSWAIVDTEDNNRMSNVTVGQVGYNLGVNQQYIAGLNGLLYSLWEATKNVAEVLGQAYDSSAFTTLLSANTTYTTALLTEVDPSTGNMANYFSNQQTFSSESTARATIATDITTQMTALQTYLAAWKTVINNASNSSGSHEVFYNMVQQDQTNYRVALEIVVGAIEDAYRTFKTMTSQSSKYTSTVLATTMTDIATVATELATLSSKLSTALAQIDCAILVGASTSTLLLPAQANIAIAITELGTANTAVGTLSTDITAVFTDLTGTIA